MFLAHAETSGFTWDVWTLIGLTGNAIFASRFFVQWVASERRKVSYIPVVFWWLSLAGSLILTVYFLHRREVVGIVGNLPNSFVYIRNLQLIRKRSAVSPPGSQP